MTRKADNREQRLPVPAGELPDFVPVPREYNRHDGWTEDRQRRFIAALADTGSVHAACKAVNMSQAGAYYLRRQRGAESFRAAWRAAIDLGVQRIEDVAMDRALNGVDVPVYYAACPERLPWQAVEGASWSARGPPITTACVACPREGGGSCCATARPIGLRKAAQKASTRSARWS